MEEQKIYHFQEGEILGFDKPLTWTSFNLVKAVRNSLSRRLGIKRLKTGHAGTLDPMATGVMIVCTGKCTKMIDQLQAGTKEYIATLRLGCTTASFDAEHEIDGTYPTSHITKELVDEALSRFRGEIMQIPPMYSAVKVDGKRAYAYVRDNEEIELKAKPLVIDELELLDINLPEQNLISPHAEEVAGMIKTGVRIKEFGRNLQHIEDVEVESEVIPYIKIRVVCSKGTYIRALARDIGEALQSGAYLIGLRRTRVGDIRVEDCLSVNNVEQWAATVPIVEEIQK